MGAREYAGRGCGWPGRDAGPYGLAVPRRSGRCGVGAAILRGPPRPGEGGPGAGLGAWVLAAAVVIFAASGLSWVGKAAS